MDRPVRAFVCDDSPFVCRLVSSYLSSSPRVEVVGTASDAERAIALVRDTRPDVVTLDLNMKNARGLEVLDRLMHESPIPVVVISGEDRNVEAITRRAFALGAVDFVSKFTRDRAMDPLELRDRIVTKVQAAARVRVVRSLRSGERPGHAGSARTRERPLEAERLPAGGVVVIGGSTGGPQAIRQLLQALCPEQSASVLVVQHMTRGVTGEMARHLDQHLSWSVKEAEAGDALQEGRVLVAPGGCHLLLDERLRVELRPGTAVEPYCPSIDRTMRSVARLCGERSRGVLLSGMGYDGSAGLAEILAAGGRTFVQDPGSCVVDSMPRCAIDIGAAASVETPANIGRLLSGRLRTRA
ncbi:MAG: chemotaxis protein CheB [Acidobacteriota bacterium]|jgi:two-component system chemotaxis response regulator CheB